MGKKKKKEKKDIELQSSECTNKGRGHNAQGKISQLPNNEPRNNEANLSHYTGVKSICNLRTQAISYIRYEFRTT